jgi:hypothetical protein
MVIASILVLIPRDDVPVYRSESPDISTLTLFPEDGTEIRDRENVFRWTPTAESMTYRFSLLNEEGRVVWIKDLETTSLIIPPSVVLQPGKTYLWKVEAFLAKNMSGRSSLHAFTYIPE